MALVTKEFKLDLAPGQLRPVVNASQGDIGRPFKADLYWNGSPWTATGYTAKLRGKKPDNTVFEYTATVSGSSVTFSTTEQMTIISGPVECELVFTQGDDVIASANFVLMVEDSPYNPDAPSESVVPGIEDLIEQTIGGDVSDEVDAWLDAHPEVTTTVQDGSITEAKLSQSVKDNINAKMYRYTELGTTSFTTPNGTSWNKTEVSFTPQLNGLLTVAVGNTDGYPTSIALCTQGYASYPDGSIYLQNSLPLQNKGYFFLRAKRGETLYLYVKWSKVGAGTVAVESLGSPSTVEYTPGATRGELNTTEIEPNTTKAATEPEASTTEIEKSTTEKNTEKTAP